MTPGLNFALTRKQATEGIIDLVKEMSDGLYQEYINTVYVVLVIQKRRWKNRGEHDGGGEQWNCSRENEQGKMKDKRSECRNVSGRPR